MSGGRACAAPSAELQVLQYTSEKQPVLYPACILCLPLWISRGPRRDAALRDGRMRIIPLLLALSAHAWHARPPLPRQLRVAPPLLTAAQSAAELDIAQSTPENNVEPLRSRARWEDCRSGEGCATPADDIDAAAGVLLPRPPFARFPALHKAEYRLLRTIQSVPGLLPLSIVVHRSLLPKVITPLLSLIVWLVSLPRGASLITFVCAADMVNTAFKWGIQRPRPRWYSPNEEGLVCMCGACTQPQIDASLGAHGSVPHALKLFARAGARQRPCLIPASRPSERSAAPARAGTPLSPVEAPTTAPSAFPALSLTPDPGPPRAPCCRAGEVDLSFPSAHTQFFSGLAFCAAALYGGRWLGAAAACGILVGLTRNHLAMHWPTDTLVGFVLGGTLGVLWGLIDPWSALLRAGSPLLSLGVATAFTVGLLCLVIAVRQLVPPVPSDVRAVWYTNALASLSTEERQATLANPRKQLKPRNLKSKIPMLATVWCTLAITGLLPHALPTAALEPVGPMTHRLVHTTIGFLGLGGVAMLKRSVGSALEGLGLSSDRVKGGLKALTYVALCAWTFLLSQLTSAALLRRLV